MSQGCRAEDKKELQRTLRYGYTHWEGNSHSITLDIGWNPNSKYKYSHIFGWEGGRERSENANSNSDLILQLVVSFYKPTSCF